MIKEKTIASDVKIHEITFFLYVLSMRINFENHYDIIIFNRLRSIIKIENLRNIKNFIYYKNSVEESQIILYRIIDCRIHLVKKKKYIIVS